MAQVMLEDTDSQLAQLVQQASSGEEVVIVRDTIAVAKIIPMPTRKTEPLEPGFGSGKYALVYMADDFDAPIEDFEDGM